MGNNFVAKLAKKPPSSFAEAMRLIYQEMEVEEMLDGKFKEARKKIVGNKNGGKYKKIASHRKI